MNRKISSSIVLSLILSALAVPASASASAQGESGECQPVAGEHYMAVAANPAAARAGCEVLASGGTAIDAAVAIQASLTVVEAQASGFGGGALLTYYDQASGKTRVFDGLASSGAATTASLSTPTDSETEESGLKEFSDAVDYSARAVGVPGSVAMLEEVHREFGTTEWGQLFDGAIDQARDGFPLAPYTAALMEASGAVPMCEYPDLEPVYCDEDEPKAAGEEIKNIELAELLGEIRDGGSEAFYDPDGSIAPAIVSKLHEGKFDPTDDDGPAVVPSLLTVDDFAAYEPVERKPECAPVQKMNLCTTPAPSGGGTALLNMLQIADDKNIINYDPDSADYAHLMIEASRLAGIDVRTYVGDPDVDGAPPAALTSAEYASERASTISLDSSNHPVEPGRLNGAQSPASSSYKPADETSQVAVVDSHGNALSMTTTVNSNFGSRVLARGMVLNNSSVNFNVAGSPINSMEPFKRPRTTVAPSIGFDEEGAPSMIVGSAGGAPIPDYIAQAVLGIGTYGLSPAEALARPHVSGQAKIDDCAGAPDFASRVESGTEAVDLLPELRDRGAKCAQNMKLLSGAGAISVKSSGSLEGAADPRRDGAAFGG